MPRKVKSESKKTGNVSRKPLIFKVSDEERGMLQHLADLDGVSLADALRTLIRRAFRSDETRAA